MKVLSLFDGISCGMLALQRAGIAVEKYDAFEIDKYAITVSSNNFPDIVHHGNVFDGDFTRFKGYDLLLGGCVPAQGVSRSSCARNYHNALARRKYCETSSDSEGFRPFMEYARALRESECKYFLYKNNFSIHQNIKDEITKYLGVKPVMINSELVSGQHRQRCYWTNISHITQPEDKGILLKDILESGISWQNKSYCMTASYNGAVIRNTLERSQRTMIAEPVRIGEYGKAGQGQRIYSVHGKSVTLSANGGGKGAKTGLYNIDLPDGDYIIRKLTPIEAERLQTLPDNYTAGISNTQRYKCIGNGWTVDVIAHILGGLIDDR